MSSTTELANGIAVYLALHTRAILSCRTGSSCHTAPAGMERSRGSRPHSGEVRSIVLDSDFADERLATKRGEYCRLWLAGLKVCLDCFLESPVDGYIQCRFILEYVVPCLDTLFTCAWAILKLFIGQCLRDSETFRWAPLGRIRGIKYKYNSKTTYVLRYVPFHLHYEETTSL